MRPHKKFSERSQREIEAMSNDEYESISPFEKRSCYDCSYLKGYVSWWCTNEQAKKVRGTSIPGCIKCPFWEPDWNVIDDKFKTPENGYDEPTIITNPNPLKWYNRILQIFQSKQQQNDTTRH